MKPGLQGRRGLEERQQASSSEARRQSEEGVKDAALGCREGVAATIF